jgi:hypothetical protein
MNKSTRPLFKVLMLSLLFLFMETGVVLAESQIRNTPRLRIRLGTNNNTINTVIYNAGIPIELNGLAGATATPTVSVNGISGGSGVYTVRVVTDVNARTANPPTNVPLTGQFSYDSSTPMSCVTPASCGTETIDFSKISWTARDGDVHNSVFQYDDSASQLTHTQIDTNGAAAGVRDRNYFQYVYANDLLIPAGTYEGIITLDGTAN